MGWTRGWWILLLGVAGAGHLACDNEARGIETCRRLEGARCARAPQCIPNFQGTAESCTRFYEVHCGSGVQPAVRDPTSLELDNCLAAISQSCDAVIDPTQVSACGFLTANLPFLDAGPDTAAADAADSQ